jgi:hypothetical protein
MTFNHAPGCHLGGVRMPCVFGGAGTTFSAPCLFAEGVPPVDPRGPSPAVGPAHDDCPRFPQRDAPFGRRALRAVASWDPRALRRGFFRAQRLVDDACFRLELSPALCPAVEDVIDEGAVQLFNLRVETLKEVLHDDLEALAETPWAPREGAPSVLEVYRRFIPLYMYKILRAGDTVFAHYSPGDFVFGPIPA